MSGNTVYNLSKETQVETGQIAIGTADTDVTTFTVVQRVSRMVFHSAAAAGYKLTFEITQSDGTVRVASVAATSTGTKDAVGWLCPFGARLGQAEFVTDPGEFITRVRAWASSAQTLGYVALQCKRTGSFYAP